MLRKIQKKNREIQILIKNFISLKGVNLLSYLIQFISHEDIELIKERDFINSLKDNVKSYKGFFFLIAQHYYDNKKRKKYIEKTFNIIEYNNDNNDSVLDLINNFLYYSIINNNKEEILRLINFYLPDFIGNSKNERNSILSNDVLLEISYVPSLEYIHKSTIEQDPKYENEDKTKFRTEAKSEPLLGSSIEIGSESEFELEQNLEPELRKDIDLKYESNIEVETGFYPESQTIPVGIIVDMNNLTNNYKIECLNRESQVLVINHLEKYYYTLNNSITYDTNIKYSVGIGIYKLNNIPLEYPMTILTGEGYIDSINFSGDENKKISRKFNGKIYNFYYGNLTLEVKNNFKYLSLFCLYDGFMGGEKLLEYSESCFLQETTGSYGNQKIAIKIPKDLNTVMNKSIIFKDMEITSLLDLDFVFLKRANYYYTVYWHESGFKLEKVILSNDEQIKLGLTLSSSFQIIKEKTLNGKSLFKIVSVPHSNYLIDYVNNKLIISNIDNTLGDKNTCYTLFKYENNRLIPVERYRYDGILVSNYLSIDNLNTFLTRVLCLDLKNPNFLTELL